MTVRRLELRCFCAYHPLLAIYGIDEQKRVYVHTRVFKQNRLYHESVVYGGEVKICCRDCFRWHRLVFIPSNQTVKLEETQTPDVLAG